MIAYAKFADIERELQWIGADVALRGVLLALNWLTSPDRAARGQRFVLAPMQRSAESLTS
jgi:hypothetical protein